jgi:predicted HTH transcriptional regulator
MSQPSITELLASPEGKTLEFKRDLSSLKQIMKTVIAFANTAGGTLVIGRNDDGSMPGVDDPLTDTERLANAISDSIAPHILPEIDIVSAAGKSFLTVRVAHWPGPFYLKAEGSEQGVYIRFGSTNRQAGPEYLAELMRIRRNISFDQLPCPELTIKSLQIIGTGPDYLKERMKSANQDRVFSSEFTEFRDGIKTGRPAIDFASIALTTNVTFKIMDALKSGKVEVIL